MSIEAVAWVLRWAPTTDPESTLVLLGLANHAQCDGTAAWPSQGTLARYCRVTDRTVRDRLVQLEASGVITRGDQRMVAHLPGNRRPVVWDIPGVIHNQGGTPFRAEDARPERHAPQAGTPRTAGRNVASDKPSLEPSRETSLEAKTRFQPVSPLLASLRTGVPNPAPTCDHGLKPWKCPTCVGAE